jgi:hypothetical protein
MNKLVVSSKQVQEVVKHASREGLYVGHCAVLPERGHFPSEVVENAVQTPCNAPFGVPLPEGRDIRIVVSADGWELEILTELGEIFVDMFLPKAA